MENNLVNGILPMKKEEVILSAACPNCGYRLEFSKDSSSVYCHCCDGRFAPGQLVQGSSADAAASNGAGMSSALTIAAQLIESADAGLIYLENHFANMEWEDYYENTELLIPEIEEMVEKSKIKYGATPAAWQLDFVDVSTLLTKKIEGLKKMSAEMSALYVEQDLANILTPFDLYRDIVANICDSKEKLIKRMENDIAYAERLSLDAGALAKMKEIFADVCKKLEALNYVKQPLDILEIADTREKINEMKVQEFAEKGIVVTDMYARACELQNSPVSDKNEYLRMFESIRGYADVNERIDAINRYYSFNEYRNFCGKTYIFKSKIKSALFDPQASQKDQKKKDNEPYDAEAAFSGTTYALYEVHDGRPAKDPVLDNITQVITVYSNRIYYIKLNSSLCYFDLETKRHYEIDAGKIGDYKYDKICYTKDGTSFFIQKKLPLEVTKAGCKKLFGQKDQAVERTNNYSVLKVSLTADYCSTVIASLVDITEHYSGNIFYVVADEPPKLSAKEQKAKEKEIAAAKAKAMAIGDVYEEEKPKITFRAYNTETMEDRQVLNDECEIHTVSGTYVLYSAYAPNAYNKDLHLFNIETGDDCLIEKNVYHVNNRFPTIVQDRIYYTVGNDDYCPLFSNNFTGTDRVEIMMNVERIVLIRAGWMYIIKGNDRNTALIKVSNDGKRRMVICTQFNEVVKITDSYVYYIDVYNSLRVVRTDGKDNVLIARNIAGGNSDTPRVIIGKTCIYYLRDEDVDDNKVRSSLYRMDLDGHNVRKLVFNVNSIKDYDEDVLMIERGEEALFELTIPVDKKDNVRKTRKYYDLRHFCKFVKADETMQTVLTLGLPEDQDYEFSKGCFGKKVKRAVVYKQIPVKKTFKRKGIAKVGAVMSTQAKEAGVDTTKTMAAPVNKSSGGGCCGCSPKKR